MNDNMSLKKKNDLMTNQSLNSRVVKATKWSGITEVVSKLITPISSMVLARLLTPEAFGVVATLTMIISFAEIFTDAGFQKYIIQHEFDDEEDREQSTNVAFWSNLLVSIVIWGCIIYFSDPIASFVGNPGLGHVISIACVSIPLAAFSSIQSALYKRDFDFKTLFRVRIVGILVPLVITIPLALYLRSFWALVLGTIARDVLNAFLLTYYSTWKPKLYYSGSKLRNMFSFSSWSMIEQVSIWLTGYLDLFIVGRVLSSYYLGIYRTSTITVGQIMGIITAATTPVLFSSLSRLQSDEKEFARIFFSFQKWVGLLVMPLGIGIFCYSDLVVFFLLGEQWTMASDFIGLWGLTSSLMVVLAHYCSEVYRSKGIPKLSVLAQWLHIIVLVPVIYWAVQKGYEVLYIARSLVRLEGILVNLCLMYYFCGFSPMKMISNVYPELIGCGVIILCSYIFCLISNSIEVQLISVLVSFILYFVVVCMFKEERDAVYSFINKTFKKIHLPW